MQTGKQAASHQEKIAVGKLFPALTLNRLDGGSMSTGEFKPRRNVVLLYFHPDCRRDIELVEAIVDRHSRIADANAELLAVASGGEAKAREYASEVELPFEVLVDPADRIRDDWCVMYPAVFVIDRFGELQLIERVGDDTAGAIDRVITKLELIELECPECGAPTWTVE